MIFSLFLTVIFFFILFFFGWQLARYSLKENRIEYLIGLSGILGIGFYIFFVNIVGYFIPIKIAFYLVLSLFLVSGLGLLYFNKQKSSQWQINKKWRKILLGTALFLMVTGSIIFFRQQPYLHGPGWPTAATIAEGNFPIVEIWNPSSILHYHYAPELFSAAIHKITGLPLYLAYNLQVAILFGILFFLGFGLIKRFFSNNNFKAFISSLLMIYAGSISFLYGIKGIPILYNLYIRHQEITAPFKFVSEATITKFSVPVLERMIGSAWGPLAFSLIIAIIYFYFYIISKKASKMTFLLCGLLLAFLALVAETYFAAFCLILLIYPFAFGFIKKDWKGGKDLLFTSFLLLIIAAPIAFLQGGVLKGVFTVTLSYIPGLVDIGGFLKANETSWAVDYFEGQAIYYSQFLIEWVLLLVVLIPAFIFLFKRNFKFASFLGVFVVVAFLIPIFISTDNFAYIAEKFHFFVRIGALWRFFYLVNLIGGLVVGLFLAHLYLSSKKIWLKRLALFIIIALMAQGLLFQLWYLSIAYPPFIWNTVAPHYAKPGSFEEKSYDWVRDNTTTNDLFLIMGRYCNNSDNPVTNYKFILNTGRMAPTYIYNCGYPLNDSFKRIKEDCDASAVKDLQYRYLYVDQNWPEGLEEKCLANNNLELKFGGGEGNEFIRIYKNLALPES